TWNMQNLSRRTVYVSTSLEQFRDRWSNSGTSLHIRDSARLFLTAGAAEEQRRKRHFFPTGGPPAASPSFTFSKPKVLFRQQTAVPEGLRDVSSAGDRFLALPPPRVRSSSSSPSSIAKDNLSRKWASRPAIRNISHQIGVAKNDYVMHLKHCCSP